ncbi:4Fe-4S binding protein [Aquisalimonas asiatica]|uniref:Formate hydrogenlyase subunit 6/NADH:ubiquinone oxidoreductase subunit (Chain I) n=1 Tax=Aquisalimonas asiatica TaxID=406100 RepID=A0A1H8RL52_9GAMM|nr:4Fe-4S binding protein [Aquisalimonas asiatica]SEO66987.1 Formate hydrogenlyase subunit 6/NADH:ubiquinone oxidoreductase subunit (chain I) [Aquisalimonas asiatica]
MTDYLNVYADMALPASGAARDAALQAGAVVEVGATSLVGYRSAGHLLLIGAELDALECAARLRESLTCTIMATRAHEGELPGEAAAARADQRRVTVLYGQPASVGGHLGHFDALLETPRGEALRAADLNGDDHPWFDLVLDLRREPALQMDLPPFGYYAPAGDAEALERALAEIPEMTGEFEKPKFFNYSPDICAHGDSGLTGCTRCLDACPADAITSIGEIIEVDPYLCQGGGTCATACPTGAIIYAYPGPKDMAARVKAMLQAYREAGGERPVLLFHDEDAGADRLHAIAADLPDHVIPVRVAEIGSVGMDLWLTALAYGAAGVVLLDTRAVPPTVRAEVERQLDYARSLLDAMELGGDRLVLAPADDGFAAALQGAAGRAPVTPAGFETFNEKRGTLRLAIDHLYGQALARPQVTAMPAGSPFGQVMVDADKCTLCMACPQVCPTNALTDAGDKPQLNFTEDLCVQCGLCQTACPEDAITLESRFLFDWEQRRQPRVLNEEQPFECVSCGKPFATPSVIERMTQRLEGHHMFQSEANLRRLKMCGDCRVKDMFETEQGSGNTLM